MLCVGLVNSFPYAEDIFIYQFLVHSPLVDKFLPLSKLPYCFVSATTSGVLFLTQFMRRVMVK